MIEYIKGELTELTPTLAVVEAAGVGYALNISLNTFSGIQGKKDVKLFVHEALVTGGRDDSFTLYGFSTRQERALYQLLITVSGVGANTARMILSASSPAELCNTIANGDERMLKSVKGIGLKTAQRIIVDLRDKIATLGIERGSPSDIHRQRRSHTGIADAGILARTFGKSGECHSERSAVTSRRTGGEAGIENDKVDYEAQDTGIIVTDCGFVGI